MLDHQYVHRRERLSRDESQSPRSSPTVSSRRGATRGTRSWPVTIARGPHPFPFRTRSLSLAARMVLPGRPGGRVRRRRPILRKPCPGALLRCRAFRHPPASNAWVHAETRGDGPRARGTEANLTRSSRGGEGDGGAADPGVAAGSRCGQGPVLFLVGGPGRAAGSSFRARPGPSVVRQGTGCRQPPGHWRPHPDRGPATPQNLRCSG
jgi:hypothetical protein